MIGWREWVGLPDLGIPEIKAKIDTGARTSSLHAFDIKEYRRGAATYVSFRVHPIQKHSGRSIKTHSLLLEKRWVKNSGGTLTLRPVILTPVVLGDELWQIELTLVNRDQMGFRMLLGRQALRNGFLVHPGKSFLNGKSSPF
jgi:hypothetical protein